MRRITTIIILASFLLSGCWYGPPETEHRILDVARKPNQFRSVAIISTGTSRPPKGLATFPNGGISKLVSSEFTVTLLNPTSGSVSKIHNQPVPKEVRNAFRADFLGWQDDTIFFQLAGCPGNECWGDLVNYQRYQITESGALTEITDIPESAKFKGESFAPMQGERNYIRLGRTSDEITMTTDYKKASRVAFILDKQTGKLEAVIE